ncbi:MAG: DUF4912 domain-containing protein [Verrucomicrobiota bacterium]
MKKTPAPAPEPKRLAANRTHQVSKTDAGQKLPATKSKSTGKNPRARSKPLLDSAIEAAKKFLKPKQSVAKNAPATNRKALIEVPPILLEGDQPSALLASGPGEKFSLGAQPPAQSFSGGELPESYGTKKLFLTARDPHWLYAHWDLTREQQLKLNAQSTDGHLVLRIFSTKIEGHPASEIHVHPESRHWFAYVERAGHTYATELGYYSALGKWTRVASSSSTVTPPEAASAESSAEFATIPFEFPFAKLMQIIEDAVRDNLPLALAIEELRRHGHPDLPRFTTSGVSAIGPAPSATPGPTRTWTPEQERALAKIINIDETRRVWMGSLEITELIRRRLTLAGDTTSPTMIFGVSSPGISSSPTSPFGGGGAEKSKGFWFNVNAELVIYGATEPGAKVTLAGHEIKLRDDGTFSYRFALPDGQYDLPAVAVSASGDDARAADLKFSRTTQYLGDVGATPQDPSLQPPLPENL